MICTDCSENDESLFKNYTRNRCISCYNKFRKKYDDLNRYRIRERQREYQKKNRKKLNEKRKEYVLKNKEKVDKNQDDFKKNNPNYYTEYARNRYNNDLFYKIKRSCRNLIKLAFRDKKTQKKLKTEIILGCSFDEFKVYIESKFEEWMNWENKGLYNGELNYGWDIDHIIPISTAETEEDVIKLNHYTNLQPLCSKINRDIKRNKF